MAGLNDRVALVTGSARGLGKGIALTLARAGADIVIADLREEDARTTAKEIEALARRALFVPTDLGRADEIENLFLTALDHFGHLDILVNTAGIVRDNMIVHMTEAQWDEVLDVNLKALFLATKQAMPLMRRQKFGRIINVSAKTATVGNIGQANYVAAKAGVLGLTLTTAKELAYYAAREQASLTCNAILPGVIDTPLTLGLRTDVRDRLVNEIPLQRTGSFEDVGCAAAFLASPEAAYITGALLPVDGGFFMNS